MNTEAAPLVSFRDPVAHVVRAGSHVFRAIRADHRGEFQALLAASWLTELMEEGRLARSTWVERPAVCADWGGDWVWIEHEAIDFPLYPHEITAQHLYDAALLTLDIAQRALENGVILKDASAWNVLFQGSCPVFCDLSSFTPHDGSALWLAYGQFGRHFVIPLLLHRYRGFTPARIFTTNRDGITPSDARCLLGPMRSVFDLAALEFVFLPTLFEHGRGQNTGLPPYFSPSPLHSNQRGPSSAGSRTVQILQATFSRLRRHIQRLDPRRRQPSTRWSNYQDTRQHYSAGDIAQKKRFVSASLAAGSGPVLDLGCNRGEYSLAAVRCGRQTVATDFDEGALRLLYDAPEGRALTIACLNLAAPTPAVGWCNEEVPSFLARARGYFETVMCLGLIHHLLITERVPLDRLITFFEGLGARTLVVEWIGPQDPMFVELAGPNLSLYDHLSASDFELAFAGQWRLVRKEPLRDIGRVLYELNRIDKME